MPRDARCFVFVTRGPASNLPNSHTSGIGVRGEHEVADRFGIQEDRLPPDGDGQLAGLLEPLGDRGGLAGDLLEGVRPVEGLAAGWP